jgi:hypothetical protein
MKVVARGALSCASLVILALISSVAPSFAQGQSTSLKDQLVGHWQLVSVTARSRTPYGAAPKGSMFIDGAGNFSVIVISAGNARNVSYFGTYTVDDAAKSMTLHIEASGGGSGINAAGRDVTRLVTLSGDELTLQNQTPIGPGAFKLTWKKAN